MNNEKTKYICLTAIFAALTFAVTRFIQIPIPLGYFNIGNSVILTFCCIIPMPYGIIVGSIGSALADLLSYPVYTIPTLIIKALMPLVFYLIMKAKFIKPFPRKIIAFSISTLIPLAGYTVVGGFLYGGLIAGLAQLPGLALEYAANIVIFTAIQVALSKTKINIQE